MERIVTLFTDSRVGRLRCRQLISTHLQLSYVKPNTESISAIRESILSLAVHKLIELNMEEVININININGKMYL
jgi:hypothetical protein